MDAVVFMDVVKQPPQAAPALPPERRPRMSVNASLIAGVATLVLAIGVGVLIGRSGSQSSGQVANATPQIIKVGGGGEETTGPANGGSKKATSSDAKAKKPKPPEKAIDSSGTSEAAAEILKPAGDVKLPPPTAQPGSKCESGAAGCKHGEFTGEFFGE